MGNYEAFYNKIYSWFKNGPAVRLFALKLIYRGLPLATGIIYFFIVFYHVFYRNNYCAAARVVFVPFTAFVAVTVLRKFINAPRPYTKYNITPLIHKDKAYESFPSRHTLSITIIAMTGLYTDVRLGILLWFFAVLLAVSRVLAGVHFIKDVSAAAIISILFGYVGFWIV